MMCTQRTKKRHPGVQPDLKYGGWIPQGGPRGSEVKSSSQKLQMMHGDQTPQSIHRCHRIPGRKAMEGHNGSWAHQTQGNAYLVGNRQIVCTLRSPSPTRNVGPPHKNIESGDHKFRLHWVVWGDKQKFNLSLSDTFALVSWITSLQILLALATIKNL